MLLRLAVVLAAATGGLTAKVATATAAAPATSTVVSCFANDCPNVDLKGDGLFSMDWNNDTGVLLCEWRFPLQPIISAEYNIVKHWLLTQGDLSVCPAQALMECTTSTINAPLATAA
ncbi:uncharacterized protein PHACADRAFT_211337 [Phanerochaete carnosa HHB-10118-sp]|uniref:Uncharacterized protein n=1 Tax=Phanerochaete carnosa (strain HHB-10118-sp) TaxID=650164 RepID=K5W3F2_PHACS|nr:uncharacterized protein PHACADRAFT_211337 [Phanerochaete carnosa HHB-10118-sp]EKM53665.1 hypothetical protein PHACADRAFT_211337 [Phanerochaete carnosa HHB-10118-sp]